MTAPARRPTPEQLRRAIELRGEAHQAQLENYLELTQDFGLTDTQAAPRLGVSHRTVERYKAELRWGVA